MVVIVMFYLSLAGTASSTHEGHQPSGKKIFTKHFQGSLFEITEHASYSVEVLPDDKEYKIGKDMVGIVVHDAHDEDVKGARLTIVHRDLATGADVTGKLSVRDKNNGLYIVSGLDLQRSGKSELSITVKKEGIEDRVKFVLPDALKDHPDKGRYSP